MTIHTRISGSIAVAVLGLTAVLGTAAPAAAGPPEINQRDCEAAGGTFDRVKGVKSCTTTSTRNEVLGPYSSYRYGGFFGVSYEATWFEQLVWQDTTTQTQKGNGDVTTETTPALLSRTVVNQQCEAELMGAYYPASVGDCAVRGMYPTY